MQETERLITLPVDALISILLTNRTIKGFTIKAYVPKTHQQFDEEFSFQAEENIFKILFNLKQTHDSRFAFAFFSKVQTDNGPMHFPMIDFSSSQIEYDSDRVREVLGRLGEKRGAILMSGRSYHYYGFDLISPDSWKNLLGNASNYPEIGEKYINHQLRDGGCSLRITTNEQKPQMPTVIAIIG